MSRAGSQPWQRMIGISVALVVAGTAVAGCGVTTNPNPRALSRDNVPSDLLAPRASSPTVTTDAPEPAASAVAQIYLLGPAFRLVAVDRKVPAPVSLDAVLRALLRGPSEGEGPAGYTTVINRQTRLRSAQVVDGIATIDLSSEFASAGVQEQILALAQFVYTATGVAGVRGVTFAVEGTTVQVPTQDGTGTRAPLTRQEYERLALP